MKEEKQDRKPIIYYYVITIIILLLLNAFVFPMLLSPSVTEVPYSEFIAQLDAKNVSEVSLNDTQITYVSTNDKGANAIYKTGVWPDENLIERLQAAGVENYYAEIPTQASPILSMLISWVLPILMIVLLGQFFMKQMGKRMGGENSLTLGKANAKVYVEAQTGKTFADVAGQDEAKDALMEIVDFLHNPQKYTNVGATLPKGALLVGPPGTGKTLLAKAVAGEAKVPFFSISGSEFVEMFVGMGAAKVRDLFKQASEKAPCIVFIDEIDTIGKKRDNASGIGGNDEREQTLNQLLSEMDGFDAKKGVVILAATNRPDSLDKALLRPGRFDRRITVDLPDQKGREAILKVHAANIRTEEDINYMAVARATSGASGADLANIINEGALRAVRQGRTVVSQTDLEESVETVIAGAQRKGAVISDRERKIISYHEIGHALVAAKQSGSSPVHKITIIPRTSGALGYVMHVDEQERVLMSKEEAFAQLVGLTGGRAAEELIFGTSTTGASNDIEKATRLARSMITRYGMSDTFGMVAMETVSNQFLGGDASLSCSPETAAKIDQEVGDLIRSAYEQAKKLLTENEDMLHKLAEQLIEKETMTGEEFMTIINGGQAA